MNLWQTAIEDVGPAGVDEGKGGKCLILAGDLLFDATIPYALRFFRILDRIVQDEPWLERDRALIDPLRTIGIERASPSPLTRPRRPCSSRRSTRPAPGWI